MMGRKNEAGDLNAQTQGLYYLVTGVWAILHRRSFEWVTGSKVDYWLVRTVGALTGAAGIALYLAGGRRRVTPEIRLLGIGTAVSFGAVDTIYSLKGRIRSIYLLDALVELGFIAAWLGRRWGGRPGRSEEGFRPG